MSEQHDPGAVAPSEPVAGAAATEVATTPAGPPGAAEPTSAAPVGQAPTEAAPAPVEAPAEPALKPHTDEPGLLQATPEKAPETPETPEGEKPAEGAAPAPEAPAYEFAIPENFTVPPERLEELTAVMREANVSPEHAGKLWGMHTAAMEEQARQSLQAQHDAFAEMRRGWRNQVASDPELGGAGFETNKATANRMLQKFVPEQHRAEFDQYLSTTGATDHPALFRFLLNLAKWADEPQGGPPPNPAPLPPRQAMGKAPQGARGGRSGFYDQPRGSNRS